MIHSSQWQATLHSRGNSGAPIKTCNHSESVLQTGRSRIMQNLENTQPQRSVWKHIISQQNNIHSLYFILSCCSQLRGTQTSAEMLCLMVVHLATNLNPMLFPSFFFSDGQFRSFKCWHCNTLRAFSAPLKLNTMCMQGFTVYIKKFIGHSCINNETMASSHCSKSHLMPSIL